MLLRPKHVHGAAPGYQVADHVARVGLSRVERRGDRDAHPDEHLGDLHQRDEHGAVDFWGGGGCEGESVLCVRMGWAGTADKQAAKRKQ